MAASRTGVGAGRWPRLGTPPLWKADRRFAQLSGLERVRAFARGDVPLSPGYDLAGIVPVDVEPGEVEYRMAGGIWFAGCDGQLAPAALAYFLDAPVANAIHTLAGPGVTLRTVHLGIRYLRLPLPGEGPFVASCRAVGSGESLAEATVVAGSGAPVAIADCRTLPMDYTDTGETSDPPAPTSPGLRPFEQPLTWTAPPEATDGWELLRSLVDDGAEAPPFWRLLGALPTQAERGRVSFAMAADGWLASPAMLLYGGALAAFGVVALEGALLSGDVAGERTRMLSCAYEFTRMVPPDGSTLVAEARLSHRGRTLAVADTEVYDSAGRLAGLGRATGTVVEVADPTGEEEP